MTITVDGAMSIASGATFGLVAGYESTTQLLVNGTLTDLGTSVTNYGGSYGSFTQLYINNGGELIASDTTFSIDQIFMTNASVMNPGDLTNDVFNESLYLPYQDVALLSNNQSFDAVLINGATMPSGQTLTLDPIGTVSTANLVYIFWQNFTVASGATLSVGAGADVLIDPVILTDSGAMSIASGATFGLVAGYESTTQLLVNGTLTDLGTSVTNSGGGYGSFTQLYINNGGELIASDTTFSIDQIFMTNASVMNPGDLTNDVFNESLYVPYQDVALLSNNQSFDAVLINGGTMPSGQTLTLDPIGTVSTANQYYLFWQNFTVASGATLSVGAGAYVLINPIVFTDSGAMDIAAGATFGLVAGYESTTQVVVDGTLTDLGTSVTNYGGSYGSFTQLYINNGGELIASDTTFSIDQIFMTNASVMNPGDLTNDVFNESLYVPYQDVALLSNNQSFDAVLINGGTVPSGQTLTLDPIGTVSTANQYYLFWQNFTVASGATLSVGAGAYVLINPIVFTDSGAMGIAAGATFGLVAGYESTTQVVVDGTLTDLGTSVTNSGGGYGSFTQLYINNGGELIASDTTFSIDQIFMTNASVMNPGDLTNDVFNESLYVPYQDVALLSNNQSFDAVLINGGTMPSGQTLTLDPIGTVSTANQYYLFWQNFTVASGATLSVGAGAYVLINPIVFTDSGAMDIAAGATFGLVAGYESTTQVVVDGTLTDLGTSVTNSGGGYGSFTQLYINNGGELIASDTTFSIDQIFMTNASVMNPGDLTNDVFNESLYVPYQDVALLSNNQSFDAVLINGGTMPSGQTLTLDPIGTVSTANQYYLFWQNFTVASGATLSVGAGAYVLINPIVFTDSGAMDIAAGATFGLVAGYESTTQVVVDGTLTDLGTSVTNYGGSYGSFTQLYINNGGELIASDTTFSIDQIFMTNASVMNPGDLTNDVFNESLYVPYQDVALLSNNQSFDAVLINGGTVPSGQTLTLDPIGTVSTANQYYLFWQNFTVASGATLSVGAGAYVLINPIVFTDSGAMGIAAGATFGLVAGYESTTQVVVDGTLTDLGTSVTNSGGGYGSFTQLYINNGGELIASDTTFSIDQIFMTNASVMNPGDLTNDVFNESLYVPYQDVALLSNNQSFDAVLINGGTMPSGQTLTLDPIGTVSTANQYYLFWQNFTVASGATLSVGAGAYVLINPIVFTDSGAMDIAAGATFGLVAGYESTTQVVVDGTLTDLGTSVTNYGGSYGSFTQLYINNGGELIASDTTFSIDQIFMTNASVMNPGDLTNDVFNESLYVPYQDVALLSNNQSFDAVLINGGTVPSGQTLTLDPIGTVSTANQYYLFWQNFTVASGATLSVGAGAYVLINPIVFTDSGAMDIAAGATFGLVAGYESTTQVVVDGTLTDLGTSVTNYGGSYGSFTQLYVNNGGELIASDTTFSIDQIFMTNASVMNPGDLTNDVFNESLYVPYQDVALLSNNQSFDAVLINGGTVPSGQTLTLDPIGTVSTANQYYLFWQNFTVASGATLSVGAGAYVLINPIVFTDSGAMDIAAGATFGLVAGYESTTQVVVDGTLTDLGTSVTNSGGSYGSFTQLYVNNGGELIASDMTFGTDQVYLASGSTDNLQFVAFSTQLAINSGASINVTSDDFTNGTVVASGNPNATISLINNFWGTINPTLIANKITDHANNSNLPYVTYEPFLSENATATYASNASAIYNAEAQTVTLSATVFSADGPVNGGTETFTILNGSIVIGTAITSNVVNGATSGAYTIPAGTIGGVYTIDAVFSGTNTLLGSSDTSHTLTISDAATTTAASSATTTFNASDQTISLSATVTSTAGVVNEGTETFTILSGSTPIGNPATADVSDGAVTASYTLPGGTTGGTYTIEAVYNGTVDYGTSTDTSQSLTVNAATTTTAAESASLAYSDDSQYVPLTATVTSAAGTVNEGSETFTILDGTTVIGTAVSVNVSGGAASVSYVLPGGTAVGTYTIQAVYNGTVDYATSTDTSQSLTVAAAATTTSAASSSATFNGSDQTIVLSADVDSSTGAVNEGTETFTILSGGTVIGTAVTVSVSEGIASADYDLPGGTSGGSYTIEADYNGTVNYAASSDTSQYLTINAAATASATASASATFTTGDQSVVLSTTVTSSAGTVDEGTETFTILQGDVVIGTAVTVDVSAGAASASYDIPAGTDGGTYIIEAVYNGTVNFIGYTDESQTLVISAAATASATASASATFTTGDQSVVLSTTVTSSAGIVDEGTETFTILLGGVVIGSPVTVDVSAGAASASYDIPAGTDGGTYIIEAVYNGTVNFIGYTDESQTLVISAAATASATASASATFTTGDQSVFLSTTVSSSAGIVDEGTETFTILLGGVVIGSPVTVNVSAGAASTSYDLPAGTDGGTYIIEAVYNGTVNFLGYTDESQTLMISAAATASATASASATFSTGDQSVFLSATVTSSGGIVDEGTETFIILLGDLVIGSPVTVDVSAGAASTSYDLPAGTDGGTYIIEAVFNGTTNFLGYTDESQTLIISAAATASATASASATFTTGDQSVVLSTSVTSAAGIVDEGSETFTILLGDLVIGGPVTVDVSAGAASTSYDLGVGVSAGTYVIEAVYNGTTNFLGYTDESQTLVISAAATATAAASASATFGDASVTLDATVTSEAGLVDGGDETFTILNGTTPVGNPITVDVSAGAASGTYPLPSGTPAGTYVIEAVYNGTTNFLGYTDESQTLVIGAAASATAAASASATFGDASVTLDATVTSSAGIVDEGTETFTILSGTVAIGVPVTVDVSAGAASGSYALPFGTPAGTYIIQAVYNGTDDFGGSSDSSQPLVISAAATATAAASASATFGDASVPLSATVTSPAGTVDEGTETFTILNGTTPVGSPLIVDVSAGAASGSYALPVGTPGGAYVIQAVYNGTGDFGTSTDSSQDLTISAAATATAAASASITFNEAAQVVTLGASVTSSAGTVDEGSLTFTLLSGGAPLGTSITVAVSAGAASGSYSLPIGTAAGTYTIDADYNGTPDFGVSSDSSQTVTVTAAATATAAASVSVPFRSSPQAVPLTATVTSEAGTVDEGTETFTLLNDGTAIGTPVTVSVAQGAADASYELPADTPAGVYTIEADYNGTPDLANSSDSTHTVTVTAPYILINAVSVEWGSQTVALQTASDGLRLLPAGRNTDMPWFNINQISITLSQSADLNPGDVSVTGITGGNYGPVTISGSGSTNIVITFAKAIAGPDRVTITIANSEIISYTRRLDVLPGDVNDDGAVNTTDGVLILRNFTPAHAYQSIYDMNGDGAVNTLDFNLYRPQIGTVLPGVPPEFVIGGQESHGSPGLTNGESGPVLGAAIDDSTPSLSRTTAVLVDAVFDAADAEGLSLLTTPSLATTVPVWRHGLKQRLASRRSTNQGDRDQVAPGNLLVVTYQPEAPTRGNRRINDVVLRSSLTEKAHV